VLSVAVSTALTAFSGPKDVVNANSGTFVKVEWIVDGAAVGWTYYGHLADVQVSDGQSITQDTVLGYLSQHPYQEGCWEVTSDNGVHTHFIAFSYGTWSCYIDPGSGSLLDRGSPIGKVKQPA
jgi:murein DD-endopeptidase MepM/ murein hydrolase activator NlpD